MKLSHVIQAVWFSPWNITPEGHASVRGVVLPHLTTGEIKWPENASPETDFMGEPLPKMEILPNGVAIIPIQGTLIHKASMLDKQCGAVSYSDIKENITDAIDAGVSKIVLNIDSPGGMSMGASETGAFVARMAEFTRIEAVTDGLMCSAAYEVAAAAHKIYSTRTSQVGSIDTYIAWLNESVRYEMMGLKVEVITTGAYKGMGVPGTSLTDDQKAYLLSTTAKYSNIFKDHVRTYRLVDDSTMQGQSFIGSDAVDAGLVDEIVEDVEECFDL